MIKSKSLTKLTPYQATFYHEWMLNPSRSDYNIILDQSMSGSIDIERLNVSLVRFVNHHLLANSNVINESDELFWNHKPPLPENTRILTFFSQEPSQEEIVKLALSPFDLENDQLVRFYAIKLNDDRYRIIYITSHILVDGLSADSIYGELTNYYNNPDYKSPISLQDQIHLHNELNDQFDDILNDERKMSTFWKQNLKNVDNVGFKFLQAPAISSTKKNSISANSISEFRFEFTKGTFEDVVKLTQTYGLSPFMYGQLILAILLHKISGTDNFVIHYPIGIKEGKDAIFGAHVNTLLKGYYFTKESTLNDLITQNIEFINGLKKAKANYLPIRKIMKSVAKPDLLEFAFAQTNLKDMSIPYEGVYDIIINNELNIDLSGKIVFEQEIRNNQLNYRVKYDHIELDTQLTTNFIETYKRLFTTILDDLLNDRTDRLISDYDLLNDYDYEMIVNNWNNTAEEYHSESTIHELFEHQAAQTPTHIALVCENISLSYSELNTKANQLAHYLLEECKIQPDELIPVCFDRSEKMLIAILGVLKAGGAYVPIDPRYPSERIEYILEDTKARFVLTEENIVDKLAECILKLKNDKNRTDQLTVVSLNQPAMVNNLTGYPNTNPFTQVKASNLAYVIYTSGTTGTPKGVMIEHLSVVNLIPDSYSRYQLGSEDVILQSANFVFDTSVEQILLAILNGNTLLLVEDKSYLQEDVFIQKLSDHNVSYINFTPSILECLDITKVKSLRTLDSGGERLSLDLYNKLKDKHFKFVNSYGVTEATITSLVNPGNGTNNMGRPIRNTSVYVLDSHMRAVPIGAIGELYIGGAGVARGYLNLPELTSKRFITNPFQSKEEKATNYNSRIYKTGDLVRFLPDGNLEYIGRNDSQIKLRGQRIELEEIENSILTYEGIFQTAVIVKENDTGIKYLVAYYVSSYAIESENLSNYLSGILPEYMVPSAYTRLEKLPITINGKLDRNNLPAPSLTRKDEYTKPTTLLQQKLVEIYSKVLGFNSQIISINDDFFRLGGDSIISIQLVSNIRKQLNFCLSVKEVFIYRTVLQLSEFIETKILEEPTISLTEQGILKGEVPLHPIQKWFFHQVEFGGNLIEFNHWNQSFLINVPELDENILKQSISFLLERHDALRMYYLKTDRGYIQKYSERVVVPPISILDQTGMDNESIYEILTEWQSGFDISKGPLFHIGYIKGYEEGRARIYFAFHHLIVDAVSWRIITEDLKTIYYNLKNGHLKKISEYSKGSSYRQWSEAIEKYKKENTSESEKERLYWREIIRHVEQSNRLLDKISCEENNRVDIVFEISFTQRLLRHSHHDYQINDLFLSAMAITLSQFTGQTSHTILLESHGREEIFSDLNITETVGWFSSMYPLVLQTGTDILSTISYTKETLYCIPKKGVGYGILMGYVQYKLPRVVFNYLGQLNQQESEGGNWYIAAETSGNTIGKKNTDSDIINISGAIVQSKLHFTILGCLPKEQLQFFTELFKENLKKVIEQFPSLKPE